jgi:PAS domain S-box-containing protein
MKDSSSLGYYSRVTSDDSDLRLFAERIKLVYSHASTLLSSSLLAVAIVDFIMWDEASREKIAEWSSAAVLIALYGYLQAVRFSRVRTALDSMTSWKIRFVGTSFALGAVWGWACVFLPPADSDIHRVFLILMAGCLAAGSVSTHAAVIESVPMFSIPALAPVAGILLTNVDEIQRTMGLVVLLFLMFLISVARRVSGVVCSTLRLRYENMDLLNSQQRSILELSMAKDSLAKSEDRFRNLAEASFEGVLIAENGFIIDFNQAILGVTGYTPEELGGKRLLDLIVPDYHALMKRRLSADQPGPAEILLMAKSGGALPVEARVKSANYKGAAIRVIAIRDIRERKKAERSLLEAKNRAEEATRLKDMFVSLVAHDLKAPISSIMSLMGIIKTGAQEEAVRRDEAIDGIMESGGRMLDMIDELLSLSRLKTGKIIPAPAFIRAMNMAITALTAHEQAARRKGITLVNEIGRDAVIFTDPDLFGQVLRNVISNAVKFCRQGDKVTIACPAGPAPVIVVSDTGPGIKEAILLDVFRQDKNVSTPGAAGERGTGLGLPFSKDIMEALGGALSLKTSAEGTRVFLYLPARKPRILLVDDDRATLDLSRKRLESLDAEIVTASDGAEALKIMAESSIDLVVSDVMMPGVDGFGILESARKNEKTSLLPIILITGEPGEEIREKAAKLGASDFLGKQSPSQALVDLVKKRIYK